MGLCLVFYVFFCKPVDVVEGISLRACCFDGGVCKVGIGGGWLFSKGVGMLITNITGMGLYFEEVDRQWCLADWFSNGLKDISLDVVAMGYICNLTLKVFCCWGVINLTSKEWALSMFERSKLYLCFKGVQVRLEKRERKTYGLKGWAQWRVCSHLLEKETVLQSFRNSICNQEHQSCYKPFLDLITLAADATGMTSRQMSRRMQLGLPMVPWYDATCRDYKWHIRWSNKHNQPFAELQQQYSEK